MRIAFAQMLACLLACVAGEAIAQPAHIASFDDHVVILELAPADVLPANLLDLAGRTVRFTPVVGGYRAENLPLIWDADFGSTILGHAAQQVTLQSFLFPYAGQTWSSLFVGANGAITFGIDESAFYNPSRDRFLKFRTFPSQMLNTAPIISPLFRKLGGFDPDDTYRRYVKQAANHLLVTWVASEPYRDTFAFNSQAQINRFQVALYSSGIIEFSYHTLVVQDGIVGLFPRDAADRASWTLGDPQDAALPGYIDVASVTAELVSANRLRFTFTTRGPVLAPGDPLLHQMFYRVFIDTDAPYATQVDFADSDADFGVFGDAGFQYQTYSPHVDMSTFQRNGNMLSFEMSTAVLNGATRFAFFVDSVDFNAPQPNFDQASPVQARIPPVLAVLSDPQEPALPPYLDMQTIVASLVGNHSVRFSFNLRGAPPPPGDSSVTSVYYRVFIDLEPPLVTGIDYADADHELYVYGGADLQYHVALDGADIQAPIELDGRTISLTASLATLNAANTFAYFADAVDFSENPAPYDQAGAATVSLAGILSPQINFSAATAGDPARPALFESFCYADIPDERPLSCDVIEDLGDRFDFLVLYTDFRLDRQEAGAQSSGAIGNLVSGVTPSFNNPADFCSAGQLQCVQAASFINTPIASPAGADLSGPFTNYARQITLVAHELGHRWLSLQQATLAGNPLAIGDSAPHRLFGLHAPAVFSTPNDVSYMAGSFWQVNGNGTYTNLTPAFFTNAGYSALDLYAMGLVPPEAVPPQFVLQNLTQIGTDPLGHGIFTATRVNFTINDVIAANGPRTPAFAQSQRIFNVGLVGIVPNGSTPSATLQQRLREIRAAFTAKWTAATGGVGTMRSFVFSDPNCDGHRTVADVGAFVLALVNPTGYALAYPACPRDLSDVNRDGTIDGRDVRAFVAALTGS